MKKVNLLLLSMMLAGVSVAQNTNFGVSSGTLGTNNSNFGYFTGNALNASSTDNAYFGTSSGRLTTSGFKNVGVGSLSLYTNSTGNQNTAIGYQSMYYNVTGVRNNAVGVNSMTNNTTGGGNNALGASALFSNTIGNYNVAIGEGAMYYSNSSYNVGVGGNALNSNTTGHDLTAVGYKALYSNTSGSEATAVGAYALNSSTYANPNTAMGFKALYTLTLGGYNTAVGYRALYANNNSHNSGFGSYALENSTASENAAFGNYTLQSTTTGVGNTAIGSYTCIFNTTGNNNVAVGNIALNGNVTGSENTALGYRAGSNISNLSNSTAIGSIATNTASNQVVIGGLSVTVIGGYVPWSNLSDGRFKGNFKQDVPGLEFINQLRPVSYDLDRKKIGTFLRLPDSVTTNYSSIRQVGFVAQDVQAIVDKNGFTFFGVEKPQSDNDHYSIRYSDFVMPLVKAVQELSLRVESQRTIIDSLLNNKKVEEEAPNDGAINGRATLEQNNPNPFSTDTEIKMSIGNDTKSASLLVYNFEGTQLKSIPVNERGNVSVKVGAGEFKPGIYLYALIVDGEVISIKRMILTQ